MAKEGFFEEIEHREVPWGERVIWVPVFYRDVMSFGALFMASMERLKALLPSPRMHPIRITPWHGVLSITALEYRDCDLGPYNEVSVSVPFTLDKATPLFTGLLRKGPTEPQVYVLHLPVTTEIALAAGIEFAGYPKFLASIEFEREAGWVTCRLAEGERHILTLAGRQLAGRDVPQSRWHAFTVRNERLLRSELVSSERGVAVSRDASHARLELGDHPIAQELEGLNIGRLLAYQYIPEYQIILTPVIESFAV